jgi:hypothetical protein
MTGIPVTPGELVDTGYLNEVARAHYRKTTSKQVVNTVAETDLLNGEITIGAGAMSTNRAVRLTAWGDLAQSTGANIAWPRYKLKLGATTLIDTNVVAAVWASVGVRWGWRISAEILNLGATNSQWASIDARWSAGVAAAGAATFTTGEGQLAITANNLAYALGGNTSAIDTTVAQALALTVTLPTANATEDVTLKGAYVEIV